MMKSFSMTIACVFLGQTLASTAVAGEEFYGVIESLPNNKAGSWVVGGRSFDVTEKTELDEDHGPFIVGACVDIEIDDGMVEEIESEPLNKCEK